MRIFFKIIALTLMLTLSQTSIAAKWWPSAIVIFGDETSDNGNTYKNFAFPISPPYWFGRFSDGPVWSEYLASEFKLIARPKTNPNYDKKHLFLNFSQAYAVVNPANEKGMFYAFGGPQANGITNFKVITLHQEVSQYLQVNRAYRRNTLAVIWLGMHDLESTTCLQNVTSCMDTVVEKIQQEIVRLYNNDLRYFIVITVPDVSQSPAVNNFFNAKQLATFKSVIKTYNGQYYAMKSELENKYPKMKIMIFNLSSYKNPLYTSLNDPSNRYCYNGSYYYEGPNNKPCTDVNNYYWWDAYNPTTVAYENMAKAIFQQIANDKEWNLYKLWWKRY